VPIFKLPVTAEEVPQSSRSSNRTLIAIGAVAILAVGALAAWMLWHPRPVADANTSSPVPVTVATTKPSAEFLDVIRSGGGAWKGRFGKSAAVVFADDPSIVPEHAYSVPLSDAAAPAELTISQCLIERGMRFVGRPDVAALQSLHGEERLIGGLLTREKMILHLRLPDATQRRLALYAWDFKDAGRVESVTIRDPLSGEVLATKLLSGFRDGHYLVFAVAGELLIEVKGEKGPNCLLAGIFLDPLEAAATTATQPDVTAKPVRRGAGAGPGRRK